MYKEVVAIPYSIVLKDDGYYMLIKIVEGPMHLLDKKLKVKFSSVQLEVLSEWAPDQSPMISLEVK